MIVTLVHVHVRESFVGDFIRETTLNHQGSVRERGNLRFDVIRQVDDPTHFILYEAFESEEDAARHKQAPHYMRWRDTVAPWMAEPRKGIRYEVVCPGRESRS
ncbi:MAG: antibiotic biosynthesis monooxygenase [Bacteroidales bacterium]|nr:antibiotic biosynthesis monooxygenase [Bacteroidales bacterium]